MAVAAEGVVADHNETRPNGQSGYQVRYFLPQPGKWVWQHTSPALILEDEYLKHLNNIIYYLKYLILTVFVL
jgi:hypothetical protein